MISKSKTIFLLSYICIAAVSAAIITPALPHIQSTFALSKGSVEWIVSIFLLGYVVGQLIYAPIANRYGRLTALRAGLAINLIGIVICIIAAHSNNFSALIVGRLVTALGAASGLSCTFMLLNELLPPDKAKHAMSLSIISFTAGVGLAVLFGSLITEYLRWQDCFIFLMIHGIVMYSLSYTFPETLKTPKPIHPKAICQHYFAAFKNKQLIIFSLVVGFFSVFVYGYSASAPIYAHTWLHLSPSQYGYWNLLNTIGMCASGFLSAFLMKRYGERTVLNASLFCIFPALIGFIILITLNINNAHLFFSLTSYLYLTAGLLFPSASFFASTAAADRASASSAMSFINLGTAMTGVIIMGYLPYRSITDFTIVLCVFFVFICTMVFWPQIVRFFSFGNAQQRFISRDSSTDI